MFKRVLAAFGVGGPSVDTVLDSAQAMPGQALTGRVSMQGGSADADIDRVDLSLVTRAEAEYGGGEAHGSAEFLRVTVAERVRVPAGEHREVPFEFVLPWETPITSVGSAPLPGMIIGVRTELVVSGAPDKGDLDPVAVHPLPSQDAVLDAFGELGFRFRAADVEVGRVYGVPQELGFYQELEFFPPPQVAGRVNEVELTFVATPHDLHVILEADKRGGFLRPDGDSFGRFAMSHAEAERADWSGLIGGWLTETVERHQAPNPAFGDPHGYHGYGGHERRGPGMGAVIGGAAAGAIGGMIIGDMVGDAFDGGGEDLGGEE
ncbi:sporulation protein [Amycolatopsis aidingensis]|uniref:sporulation protein n=1 Tax=Amycolatopsis aidingensis TaxID=2842453 RepID=UPI001C0B2AF7|nr:sporulation protein [Amycolatopsis aidingensis]